ncbi:MAG: leucine-rich repeat domain-containing protein [Crocinitomicaceae bacterium]
MKKFVNVCWISFLLLAKPAFSQKDHLFKSIEKACSVPVDSVYRLDLSRNRFTEIPKKILQFQQLRELNLSKNKLRNLPDNFIFPHLRVLDLSKNKLEVFPAVLCKNISIRHLFLGKNNIPEIPECIGSLQDLIVLDIWFNPIDDLPTSLTKLRNLRSLDLSGLNFSKSFQKKWTELLPWVKIEFDAACDCAD